MTCFRPITAWQMNRSYMDLNTPDDWMWSDYNYTYNRQSKLRFKRPNEREIENFREIKVPCTKCIGCLLDKANMWSTRVWAEKQKWTKCCFVTLTYDDEHLPANKQLNKKDLQDFWKRLRYHHKGYEYWDNPRTGKHEKPIRYIVCGEYGPNPKDRQKTPYGRPHYHAIIFNYEPDDLKFYKENHNGDRLFTSESLKNIWENGFVIVGKATYESACYVARYVTKKQFKRNNLNGIQEEFIETSRNGGIGIGYWIENKDMILRNKGILVKIKGKVKLKNIPEYYLRKFDEENWEECQKYKYKKQKIGLENWKEILKRNSKTESEYKEQMYKDLIEKAKKLKRTNMI